MSKKLKKLESRLENEHNLEMEAWSALYNAMCDAGINEEWACDALWGFEVCLADTNKTRRKIIKLGGIIDES
jgi:hypothetical protein